MLKKLDKYGCRLKNGSVKFEDDKITRDVLLVLSIFLVLTLSVNAGGKWDDSGSGRG